MLVDGLDNTTHLLPAQPERDARPDRRVVGDGHGEDVDRDVAERDAAALRRHERVVDVLGALGGPRRRRRDAARFRFFGAAIDEQGDLVARHR